jgi:rubredoxin
MEQVYTIKINFRGGIISPGDLYNIMVAAAKSGTRDVSIGLRQQLLVKVANEDYKTFTGELQLLNVKYENGTDQYPNVVSSYPAEEVFITQTWLSEGVYKDIFDLMDYEPRLKINISDSNQSFTPLLTGNINWVASLHSSHFWHLFIRFPKTNTIYEWDQLVYTNDVARVSKEVERLVLLHHEKFFDNSQANGDELFAMLQYEHYIIKPAERPAKLPAFNLPYYEGLNRYNDKYWLGIYRRDELFNVEFLKDISTLCLQTKVGQLCATPWKSLIIKGIEERDRPLWNDLLAKHQVNMRHAANELNFQVEDDCSEGLALKHYLVKHLNQDDVRTFGVCVGIKTRRKSEVFSSILVRRKPLLTVAGIGLFHVYDILCAHDFNPNERTGFVFSSNNPKFLLPEQLRRAILSFYAHHKISNRRPLQAKLPLKEEAVNQLREFVHQCRHCLTIYDDKTGDESNGIKPGVSFELLPADYSCSLCEAPKEDFTKLDKSRLWLQPV